MFESVKSILFATNFSQVCRVAFESSISLAARYNANLVLLHVIERDIPLLVENDIRSALGEENWERLQKQRQDHARHALIGKMTPESLAQTALHLYCEEAKSDDPAGNIPAYETVVSKGNIVSGILSEAARRDCDLIVIGGHKGFLKNKSLGPVVKGVMRQSKIPVLFVPPKPEKD